MAKDQILDYVKQKGQASPGELSTALKMPIRTISYNLSILADQKLLVRIGQGRGTVYALASTPPSVGPAQTSISVTVDQIKTDPLPLPKTPIANPEHANPGSPIKTLGDDRVDVDIPQWLKWTKIDPQLLRERYEKINNFWGWDSYRMVDDQTMRFSSKYGSGFIIAMTHTLADALVWILAVLSLWAQQIWVLLRGRSVIARSEATKQSNKEIASLPCLPAGRQAVARNDRRVLLLKILSLLLLGAFIGYQLHRLPKNPPEQMELKDQISDLQNQLRQSSEDLYQAKQELYHKNNEIDSDQVKINDLSAKSDYANDLLRQAHEQQAKLTAQIEQMENNYATKRAEFQSKVDELNRNLNGSEEDLQKVKRELSLKSTLLDNALEEKEREFEQKNKQLKNDLSAQIAGLNDQITLKDQALQNLRTQLTLKEQEIKNLQEKLKAKPTQAVVSTSVGPVSMAQIVNWTKQQLPPSEIISRIKASGSSYHLQAEDINWLHQQGVGDEVMAVMK